MIPNPPCQITFVGMDGVEAARVEVRGWLTRLGVLTTGMTGGHVLIQAIEERRQERRYHVRMDLTMTAGEMVIVALDHPSNVAHEDLYVAIRNAFRAARRQLEVYREAHPIEAQAPPSTDDPLSSSHLADAHAIAPPPRLDSVDRLP